MKVNQIYELCNTPKIWLSIGPKYWDNLRGDKNEKSYLLTHPMWYFSFSSLPLYFKMKRRLSKKNIELIVLNNSKEENLFAKLFGFKSHFINQNLNVNEHIFKPLNTNKVFDCVYIAQAAPFKRIHLTEKIKSIYFITFCNAKYRDINGAYNIGLYEPRVKHAKCNESRMTPHQVNLALNKSRCGLALSAKEGAMFALVEYLLAGIPVVSTKSRGGRDVYFNNDFVKVVKADPNHIKKATEVMIAKNISPEYVHERTLKIMRFHREKLYKLVSKLKNENYGEQSLENFTNRIWGSINSLENHAIIDIQDNF